MIYHVASLSHISRTVAGAALLLFAMNCPGQSPEETAEDFRARGNQALADGIYSAAARFFTRYRQAAGLKEPEFSDATALLAEAFYREGKFTEAGDVIAWHTANSPGLKDRYYRDLLIYWQAAVALKTGDAETALTMVNQILETRKEADDIRVAALVLKGEIHVHTRQWTPAEQAFQTVIQDFSTDPADQEHVIRAKLGLADALKQAGRTEEAIALLTRLAEDPALPTTARTRAQLQTISAHISRNEIEQALAVYTAIEARRPLIANVVWHARLSELFNALVKADSNDVALSLIPGLTATAPDAASRLATQMEACKLLMVVGRLAEARESLAKLTETPGGNPSDIAAMELRLAELYDQDGQTEPRIDVLRRIISREEVSKDIRFKAAVNLGNALTAERDYDNGTKAYVEAARLADTRERQAQALFNAGEASLRKAEIPQDDIATRRLDYSKAANFFKNVADNFPETEAGVTAVFKLALAKSGSGAHLESATVLGPFLENHPAHVFWEEAALLRIRGFQHAGEKEKTAQAVNDFITQKPDSPFAPPALMEGFQAARQAGDYPQANGFLSAIIDKEKEYAQSGLPPHALYERARLNFLYGKTGAALTDCDTFLDKYPRLPLAADIQLWQGDHYFSIARQRVEQNPAEKDTLYGRALKAYLGAVSQHPRTPAARRALFEVARIHHYLNNIQEARRYLDRLIDQLPVPDAPRLGGMAYIQLGDILSETGDYLTALEAFRKAREHVTDTDLVLASKGREADMWISLTGPEEAGSEKQREYLVKAAELLTAVAETAPPASEVRAEALFKLGKTWEMRGDEEQAVDIYLTVAYSYEKDVKSGVIRHWHYYPRAVFAAGGILERQGKYEQALRCYQRLARSKLPAAAEAEAKVQQIKTLTRG
ncbi:MAG: tetratricopeptide repeat protein [Lentisphaeria bacterium]|nr:tetratricopeptide repeat protein [Lentisphaeria bacterium]